MSTYKPHGQMQSGEDGSGFFSNHTLSSYDVISLATPMVLNVTENIKFEKGDRAFTICDYGAADGGTSMYLISNVIKWLKLNYGENQPVHVIYEDQPTNDFKSLFLRIHGMIPGHPSYLKEFQEVYVTACGTGFYDQCLPAGSVNLVVSFTAMHWLSRRPCNLSDTLVHILSKSLEEKNKFTQQAAEDWETILLQRAKELAEGGQMVLVCLCVDDMGQYAGKTGEINKCIFDIMTILWKDMMSEGKLTEDEFVNTTFNFYLRTEAEFRAPFQDPKSKVVKAGLKLIDIKTMLVKCPHYKEWNMSKKGKADATTYAKKLVGYYRLWSNSTFIAGLSDYRTSEEKTEIVDELFQRYEDLVAANPQDHYADMVEIYLQIPKH